MCIHYEIIRMDEHGRLISTCKLCGRTKDYSDLQKPYEGHIYHPENQHTVKNPMIYLYEGKCPSMPVNPDDTISRWMNHELR